MHNALLFVLFWAPKKGKQDPCMGIFFISGSALILASLLFIYTELGTYVGELGLTNMQWNQYYAHMFQTFADYQNEIVCGHQNVR
jgi:hypothetical protein